MKKGTIIALIVMLAMSMVILTACGGSLGVAVNEDNSATITADKAAPESTASAGTMTVEKGQKVVIEPTLEDGGVISVKFIAFGAGEDADASEIVSAADSDNAVLDEEISGTESIEVDIPAGDYMVRADAVEKATGTIQIYLK